MKLHILINWKKKTLMKYLIALGICNYLIIILQLLIVHANDLVNEITLRLN